MEVVWNNDMGVFRKVHEVLGYSLPCPLGPLE